MDLVISNSSIGEWVTLTDVPDDLTGLSERLGDICAGEGFDVSGALEREGLQEAADELLTKGKTSVGGLDLKTEELIRMPGRMPWRRMPGSPKSLVRELLPKASVPHNAASGCLRRIVVQNVPKQVLGREIAKQIVRQNAARQMLGPEIAKQMALPGIGIPLAAVSFCANLLVAVAAEKLGKSSTPDEL